MHLRDGAALWRQSQFHRAPIGFAALALHEAALFQLIDQARRGAGIVIEVAGEIGTRSIELAEELSLLNAELSYLPERRQAYEGLAKRTNHPGIKGVAVAMTQAERYGTPLGNALRVMAKENRELRIAAAEKKAAQLPAKLTVPMVIFFLPVLFIVILTPGMMRAFDKGKDSAQEQRIERHR